MQWTWSFNIGHDIGLNLNRHYYSKPRACIENPAHHALHEFDQTTRDLYATRPNGTGGMARPPTPPDGLKVEEAMASAEINAEKGLSPEVSAGYQAIMTVPKMIGRSS